MDILTLAQRTMAAVARQRRVRRDVAYLAQLDDRMLRDIGLDRRRIGHTVRFGHETALAGRGE